ncbi:MAG: methyltransferase domain-containing protein [Caldilinea sp. CFX5]|nr:methyltransferase domain-containing protein [Caldilinea sp. CFX5]
MTGHSYLHGSAAAEQQRLEVQADLLGGATFLPPLTAGMTILEVGCGTGAIARAVAGHSATIKVVGIDRDEAQLTTARRLAQAAGLSNLEFLAGEATQLDLADHTFDAAYCRFLLEHLPDPLPVVREMRRVVKPGGWLCAYEWEPGCFSIYPDAPAIEQVWREVYRLQQQLGGDPWVGRKLLNLFQQAGLHAIQAEGRAWSLTAQTPEQLQQYVTGAREIIRQATPNLLQRQALTPAILAQAEGEYQTLLHSPAAFVFHGFCRAVGSKPESQ